MKTKPNFLPGLSAKLYGRKRRSQVEALRAVRDKVLAASLSDYGAEKGVMRQFLTEVPTFPHPASMPRTPRVEYENAVYHVMARGDRREAIVHDDSDRDLFVDTFAEVCGRTGWEVFAWVLMDNHYHAVFRTPEPNLVAGMQWFQNTFTRRFNARHRLWGHLFGGRHRAIPVEDEATSPHSSVVWRDYPRTVIDYVHLNPGRAGLADGAAGSCRDFPWSSLAKGYATAPGKRPPWLAVAEGLELAGSPDTVAGRRNYIERIDGIIREEGGDPEAGGVPLSKQFERGWFWGSEAFRERLTARIEKLGARKSRDYRSRREGPTIDHGIKRAGEIIAEACDHYGIDEVLAKSDCRGDWRRTSAAWAVARETSVPHAWIADRLNLKSPANVSQQIRRFRLIPEKELSALVRRWRKSRRVC